MWANRKTKTVEEVRKELRALVARDFVVKANTNIEEYDVAVMLRKKNDHKDHMTLKFDEAPTKKLLSLVEDFITEQMK